MITSPQAKQLKKVIGFPHIEQVVNFMHDNGVRNREGASHYSRVYVSLVFNGHLENPTVEKHIWKLAELRTEEQKIEEGRKEALIKEWS